MSAIFGFNSFIKEKTFKIYFIFSKTQMTVWYIEGLGGFLHRHSIGIKLLNGITVIKLRDGLAKVLREEQVLRSFKCVFS